MTSTKTETEARERALAYFASKAALTPAEVSEQIAAAFDSLEAVLKEVAPARATVRPRPDEWSAQEVLDHLVETFRPGRLGNRRHRVEMCGRMTVNSGNSIWPSNAPAKLQRGHIRVMPKASQFNKPFDSFSVR